MQRVREPKQANDLLRYERKKRGWSQARLAEVLDIDPSMVSRWEVGERGPASEYQERLCEIFKKNAVELGFIESLQIPCPSPAQPLVSSISSMDTDDALIRINQDTPAQFISPVTLQQEISSETLVLHEIEGDDMKKVTRRKFLEVGLEVGTEIGVASLVVPGILNSSESDRLLWMFEDSSIDKTALSSLKKITDSHWQLVYGGVPKRGLLSSVTGHLQSMEHFLQVSQPTAKHRWQLKYTSTYMTIPRQKVTLRLLLKLRDKPLILPYMP